MKKFRIIPHFVVLFLLLSACQTTATEAPAPAQPVGTEYPAFVQPSAAEYPAFVQPSAAEYPAPGVNPSSLEAPAGGVDVSSIYPGLADGSVIDWPQLDAFARNGEIARILQSESSGVSITLKDGRSFSIAAPQPGFVEAFLQACGDICKDIEIVTE